jgi:ABC-type Fe3+/spermidine/putrescine transport system ATPase subunit
VSFEDNKVVAGIRPEFVVIREGRKPELPWKGLIEAVTFVGGMIRYEVRAENGKIVVAKIPFSSATHKWKTGDQVNLMFPPDSVLLYPYPQLGLEKEVSVE